MSIKFVAAFLLTHDEFLDAAARVDQSGTGIILASEMCRHRLARMHVIPEQWMGLVAVGIFMATYLGVAVGGVPGLALDRTGIALLGAIAMVATGALSMPQALQALDARTLRRNCQGWFRFHSLVLMKLAGNIALSGCRRGVGA